MVERVPLVRHAIAPLAGQGHHARVTIPYGPAAGLSFSPGAGALVYVSGRMEERVQQTVVEVLASGDVFFDVGANVGFYTLLAARLVRAEGRVVAFEPNPANVKGLRNNVTANGFSNVTVVAKAASAKSGEGMLAAEVPFQSVVVASGTDPGARAIAIDLVALDDFVSEHPELSPSLVKIDAEGHELKVIAGLRTTLETRRPKLIVEMHGTNPEVAAALLAHDYVLRTLEVDQPVEEAPGWVHVLALPPER